MHRLIGHAIVSDDDRIADASGSFPDALRNESDWTHFQAQLDRADLVLVGRASHEAAPNVKRRPRLVLSRAANGLERRADGWWLDPTSVPLADVLARLLPAGGEVAVPGGRVAFDLVGAAGFAAFHLSRAQGVRLPGGRPLFDACARGRTAADILSGGGLLPGPAQTLDHEARVTLTVWSRP